VPGEDERLADVLALAHGDEALVVGAQPAVGVGEVELQEGDTLLLQTTVDAVGYLAEAGELVVTHEEGVEEPGADEPSSSRPGWADVGGSEPSSFVVTGRRPVA
jgi:hypothetical protein